MEIMAVFLPFAAFLLAMIFGGNIGDRGVELLTCGAVILSACFSVSLFASFLAGSESYHISLAPWIVSGDFAVTWSLRMDMLTVVMMNVITIVSACVHVYSVGYMSEDSAKSRFMAYLSLFTFAMLMLVTADNLLQLFFGWEGVGLASYLLIGFWNQKTSANAAAQKAFVVNRIGDFGLILGIMAVYAVFKTLDFDLIFEQVPAHASTYLSFFGQETHALTLIGILLFIGAVGKSAQLGLHTWLPDAMEGPTPVSALIHAATMVTAGIFLIARFSPLYEYAPAALFVITIIGALTAIIAATIGLTQFDIKRVIAYSTMSQLGYMVFALGVSAYSAAMFHLVTHAFFKALLFLGAGSVIHALSGEQDMRRMGGLWRKIPYTYGLIWIGSLALAGIIPFAGYYSKDIMLEAAWMSAGWHGQFAFWLGIAAAFLTAFYSWRLICLTFHGEARASKDVMSHVHESPPVMLVPLVVLAIGAIASGFMLYGGFVGGGHHATEYPAQVETVAVPHDTGGDAFWGSSLFVKHENDTVALAHSAPFWVKKLPLLMGLSGIALACFLYLRRPAWPRLIAARFSVFHKLFSNKWYFDKIYHAVFVRNAHLLGLLFWKGGDQNIIDRFGPNGTAHLARRIAGSLGRFQSGYVFQYAFVMIIALIALLSWFIFRANIGF